jgi:flagellar capping protein FliD
MEFFNPDSLVTENGRVRFSGFASGIDFQSAVEGIMEARRIPVDRLETKIEENTAKIDALNTLQQRLQSLEEAAAHAREGTRATWWTASPSSSTRRSSPTAG